MRVAILEENHFETVYALIQLFDNGQNQLYLFTESPAARVLREWLGEKSEQFNWTVRLENESTYKFCERISTCIQREKIALLYLSTVSRHHIVYAALLRKHPSLYSIWNIHDINEQFRYKPGWRPRSWLRWWGQKKLRTAVDALNVISTSLVPALEKATNGEKKILTIPGAVWNKTPQQAPALSFSQLPLRIVVPGSIDEKRRDYEEVLELAAALPAGLAKIVVLGGGSDDYSRSVWEKCRQIGPEKLEWSETGFVPAADFEAQLAAAHFIWMPVRIHSFSSAGTPEIYGTSKATGNLFDAIRHAKPFFHPAALIVDEELLSAAHAYENVFHLLELLQNISGNAALYEEMATGAQTAASRFTVEAIRVRFPELFSSE